MISWPSGNSGVHVSIPSNSNIFHTTRTWPYEWITQVPDLKILGISFSHDISSTTKLSWHQQFQVIQNILIKNTHRHFTFYGRVLFIKQHVISQLIHIAHALPCNKTQALLIKQKLNKFLFAKRREHPSLEVLIRPRNQGGLGAILPFQFFQSLFTRQVFKSLIHPEEPERTAAVYWLGPHLKNMLPNIMQPKTHPNTTPRNYFTNTLPIITKLLKSGIITSTSPANHRVIYNHLISDICQPGRTEKANPDLDWSSIWRWVASLKGKTGELVWDFNHSQLPTMLRLKRLRLSDDDQCPLCNSGAESDEHLMLTCPEKFNITNWLRIQLTKHGCSKPLRSSIHGDVGNPNNKKSVLALIQAFIIVIWTARTNNTVPTINELKAFWTSLLHKNKQHSIS